jgi:glycyl-tRNA synthetase beta chain
MLKPLLIEIGVEEFPAIPLLKELNNIEKKWLNILEEYQLTTDFHFYYTPRRLVLWHPEFPVKQPDREEEFWGPPKGLVEKNPKAGEGFARKVGVPLEKLSYRRRKGGEFLYHSRKVEGRRAEELIGEMVQKWLKSLNFGKEMVWGECSEPFIRPVRWLLGIFGEEFLEFQTHCVKSGKVTYGHRIFREPIPVEGIKDYFEKLKKFKVVLFQEERRERILKGIGEIEEREGVKVGVNQPLLEEIVAITEYPTPLVGKFEEEFLQLPPEVVIVSMETHQRYFPVFRGEKLTNRFVVVANTPAEDFSKIISGNERVLRARLKDALFFWEQDLKKGLSPVGLEEILYFDQLGSLADKVERELRIALRLAELLKVDPQLVAEAVHYGKGDLLTEMVYEFPELQGVMGYYYSRAQGVPEEVAVAIKEQYQDQVSNPVSLVLNLAVKLENLLGLFAIGKVPKGNRDPFALRRSGNHLLRLLLDWNVEVNLQELLEELAEEYRREGLEVKPEQVLEFLKERLYHFYPDVNPAVVRAVLKSGTTSLPEIDQKIKLLNRLVQSEGWEELASTFKRVANILKGVELPEKLEVEEELLVERAERELWERFKEVVARNRREREREIQLDNLLELKPWIDQFFDQVRVNVEDPALRRNRQQLIGAIYNEFKRVVGDLKEVS